MERVHLLFRSFVAEPKFDDYKLIGVYSSYDNAKAAQTRIENKLTVKDGPTKFWIMPKAVDKDGWEQTCFY